MHVMDLVIGQIADELLMIFEMQGIHGQ